MPTSDLADKIWVRLPDGRKGVIDHFKTDGKLGVRPVDEDGRYLLNPSAHWPVDKRAEIPEEHAYFIEELVPLPQADIPERYR